MMSNRALLLILVLIILAPFNSQAAQANDRWFDSTGRFHFGDLLDYLSKIRSDQEKDPVISMVLKRVADGEALSEAVIGKLSSGLNQENSLASIFPTSKDQINKAHKEIIAQFKKNKNAQPGTLFLQTISVKPQGLYQIIEGSDTNVLIAIPADPKLIAQLTTEWTGTSPNVANLFAKAVQSGRWKDYAQVKTPDPMGRVVLDNLAPGDWLIWVNQFNMLTYLYKTRIESGKETQINLERVFAIHHLRLKSASEK